MAGPVFLTARLKEYIMPAFLADILCGKDSEMDHNFLIS